MTTEMPKFTPNELVWYEKGGEIHSSGYKVESLFKTLGIAPMTTLNQPVMNGGCGSCGGDSESFSDLFRFMGVPAGLSTVIGRDVSATHGEMVGGGSGSNEIRRVEGGLVPSSLYDKLVQLAGPDEDTPKSQRKQTRRRGVGKVKEASRSGKKRTTRKHRR
jgi:hypothetical protein